MVKKVRIGWLLVAAVASVIALVLIAIDGVMLAPTHFVPPAPAPVEIVSQSSSLEANRFDINRNGKVDCDDAVVMTQRTRSAMASQSRDESIDFDSDGWITIRDWSLFSTEFRKENPNGPECLAPSYEEWKAQQRN